MQARIISMQYQQTRLDVPPGARLLACWHAEVEGDVGYGTETFAFRATTREKLLDTIRERFPNVLAEGEGVSGQGPGISEEGSGVHAPIAEYSLVMGE